MKIVLSLFFFFGLCFYCVLNAQPKLVLPIGHSDAINKLCYSPNGKYIVTSADDNTAKIWDASSGTLLRQIKHSARVHSATYSPDGEYIVTACTDGNVKIWKANSGVLIREFKSKYDMVWYASFSPDGKYILSAHDKKVAKIWRISDGELIKELTAHSSYVLFAAYSKDGKYIVTASDDKTSIIWDLQGKALAILKGHEDRVNTAAFSPDGKYVVTASEDKTIRTWRVADGTQMIKMTDPGQFFYNAFYTGDGKFIISSCNKGVRFWNPSDGKLVKTIGDEDDLGSYAIDSPDGNYIATAHDLVAKIWNISDSKLITELKGHTQNINSIKYDPGGKNIVVAARGNYAKIWDESSFNFIDHLKGITAHSINAAYSSNNKFIAVTSTNILEVWRVADNKKIFEIKNCDVTTAPAYSPDGESIAVSCMDRPSLFKKIKVVNLQSGSVVNEIQTNHQTVRSLTYNNDGSNILAVCVKKLLADPTLIKWNTLTGEIINTAVRNGAVAAFYSPDNRFFGINLSDNTLEIWDPVTFKPIKQFEKLPTNSTNWMTYAVFSPDGKFIASASRDDNDVKIWNVGTGKNMMQLIGHDMPVAFINYDHAGKFILTASEDYTIKKWDAATGKLVYTFFPVDSLDYFVQIPSGYFKCTQNAAKLLHYVKGLQGISFEQLDIKYNRPDKVLAAIGKIDTSVIDAYKKAYFKRIKKLGVDTTSFAEGYSVPETEVVNRNKINISTTVPQLVLHIKGVDSSYPLNKFNVWINEVPVFGLNGISIKRKRKTFDTTITVTLSQGDNRIETSVINANGIESYRSPLLVKYSPAQIKKGKIYFIGIGINQFLNPSYNLQWSVKDIRDLAFKLKNKHGADIRIDTLFDDQVTRKNVLSLKQKLLSFSEDDQVIISYSGHGVLNKDYDYFLSTYSIQFEEPEKHGLPYDDLESLLDGIKPRKKLLLIDACHSGELDKDEIANIEKLTNQLDSSGITHKSSIKITPKKNIGMANSFELMQSLFVNVGKGTGATIISAAGGMQYAQERGDLKNGVFTYSILEAFNQYNELKVSELKRIVGARVTELTHGLQKPTFRNETNNFDWRVW